MIWYYSLSTWKCLHVLKNRVSSKRLFPWNNLKGKSSAQGQMCKRLMLSVLWQTQPYSWAGSLVSRACKSTLMHTLANTHTHKFARKAESGRPRSTAVWVNGFHRSRRTQVACLLQHAARCLSAKSASFFSFSFPLFLTSRTAKSGYFLVIPMTRKRGYCVLYQ